MLKSWITRDTIREIIDYVNSFLQDILSNTTPHTVYLAVDTKVVDSKSTTHASPNRICYGSGTTWP